MPTASDPNNCEKRIKKRKKKIIITNFNEIRIVCTGDGFLLFNFAWLKRES